MPDPKKKKGNGKRGQRSGTVVPPVGKGGDAQSSGKQKPFKKKGKGKKKKGRGKW